MNAPAVPQHPRIGAAEAAESLKRAPAVDRALTVLEMLGASNKGMTLAEVARHLGIPRSSAFYILQTIEERGYITRASSRGRYNLTVKLFELANRSFAGIEVRDCAAPSLRQLMERTGMTVHLAVLAENEIMIIGKWSRADRPPLPTWIGKRLPWHCTGAGKALVAHLSDAQLEAAIRRGLIRYNDNTIVSAARMRAEIAKIRRQRYALDDEEETLGLRCIGAPIFRNGPEPLAAISVAGTLEQIREDNLDEVAALVTATAEQIRRRFAGAEEQGDTARR